MSDKKFYVQLGIISVLSAAFLLSMHQVPQIQHDMAPSWIAFVGFIVLAIVVLYAGRHIAKLPNPNTFTMFSLAFVMLKLFFAAGIILVYTQLREPHSSWFVAPFFAIYIIFTVFESNVIITTGKS